MHFFSPITNVHNGVALMNDDDIMSAINAEFREDIRGAYGFMI